MSEPWYTHEWIAKITPRKECPHVEPSGVYIQMSCRKCGMCTPQLSAQKQPDRIEYLPNDPNPLRATEGRFEWTGQIWSPCLPYRCPMNRTQVRIE